MVAAYIDQGRANPTCHVWHRPGRYSAFDAGASAFAKAPADKEEGRQQIGNDLTIHHAAHGTSEQTTERAGRGLIPLRMSENRATG